MSTENDSENKKDMYDDSTASENVVAPLSPEETVRRQRSVVLVVPSHIKNMGYTCVVLMLVISVLSYLNMNMMIESIDSISALRKENGELMAVFNRILYSIVTANSENARGTPLGEAEPQQETYAAE